MMEGRVKRSDSDTTNTYYSYDFDSLTLEGTQVGEWMSLWGGMSHLRGGKQFDDGPMVYAGTCQRLDA